jgi:hypothetical protein
MLQLWPKGNGRFDALHGQLTGAPAQLPTRPAAEGQYVILAPSDSDHRTNYSVEGSKCYRRSSAGMDV